MRKIILISHQIDRRKLPFVASVVVHFKQNNILNIFIMECDKIKKFYLNYCEKSLSQNENYNISYPVEKELRTQNCLKTIELMAKHCKMEKIDGYKCMYDEK